MKQAIHIFAKDLRRLWPQALIVSGLFALSCSVPPWPDRSGFIPLLHHGNLTLLIILACWILGANLVQEDSPAQDSPFWMTRPYSRLSLCTAKLLFLFVFVFLPLVGSGIAMQVRTGVSVSANVGVLLTFDLFVCTWLILPMLALAAVTPNLKMFFGGLAILFVVYEFTQVGLVRLFSPIRLFQTYFIDSLQTPIPVALIAIGVVAIQYSARKTQWSRLALVASVIVTVLVAPFNNVAILSAHTSNPGFDPKQIHVAFDESAPVRMEQNSAEIVQTRTCVSIPLQVDGLPEGMILHQNSFFTAKSTSDYAGARSINTAVLQETGAGYREILCLPGPFSTDPEEIEVWPNFSVSSAKTIAQIPARPGTYNVDGAGRCEIGTPFPENTQLRCDLEQPILGSIVAGLEFPGYKVYSEGFLHFAHVADMDPVSLFQFDGSSADVLGHAEWAFEEAFNNPAAHFVLRNERYLGSFPGHLVYRKLMFPWTRIPQAKEVTK